MKKHLTSLIILLSVTCAFAQKKGSKEAEPKADLNLTIYKNALKYNDFQTAIIASQAIVAIEGENSTFKDSLAILYYNTNNAVSCHLMCKELLVKKPNDQTLLELNAICLSKIGSALDAIGAYETLFNVSKNRYHGYKLAQLQFEIKRLAEAMVTINSCLTKTEELKATIAMNKNKDEMQEVPLNAAIQNLKGLVSYELKDAQSAVKCFEEALKIYPEFETAKANKASIEALEKK
ncbi:MAG: tetratricopeptide repeat protein [Flavobacteriales bacterium]|nr:tetratricopeptide repeat protein [Flavobacteriales bacterium]